MKSDTKYAEIDLHQSTCQRLSHTEVEKVIDICLKFANRRNTVETTIHGDAKSTLVILSEGYPHFIQQFGFCAFVKDTDNIIDDKDVLDGAFGDHGALEVIGDKYYRDNFYSKVRSEAYRQVLRIMADNRDGWTSRKTIKSAFKGEKSTLNNAIKALRDRGIILSKEGEPGVYRLQHRAFAWWIKMYTTEEKTFIKSVASNGITEK